MGFLLHHSVTESAQRRPEHEAFRYDGESITFGELDRRSDQVAHRLLAEGLQPSDRVGLYMTKGLELPVALYGVLKAGGAYVPIDPMAPPSRVEFMMRDCGILHLVTRPEKKRPVRELAALRAAAGEPFRAVLGLTTDDLGPDAGCPGYGWDEIATGSLGAPPAGGTPEDLAYVMYTSGSTGVPKGLMHTHASGRSYASLSGELYGVTPEDRLGNHSPLHFDMSTFEFLTAPLFGATTVLIPEEATMFPVSLSELIERERMTFWYSVPLALIQLVTSGRLEEFDGSSLRWVLFGGEPFPPKYLWRLMDLWPNARFSNSYGPAEVNQCTYFHVPRSSHGSEEPIPLGAVWPGAEGLLVDAEDEPIEGRGSGELLIRAPTRMRGYWNRPDLNARAFYRRERFPGFEETFYRTGDIVERSEDGQLHFVGRRDRQIKIRGYRVELDEVESVFAALDVVEEAAAIAVKSDDEVEIIAVLRVTEPEIVDAEELRRSAAGRLSAYAVPSRVETRTDLPRTGSGKIDRRRLTEEFSVAR